MQVHVTKYIKCEAFPFWVAFDPSNTVVKMSRKEKVILQNEPHITPKWLLNQKWQQKVSQNDPKSVNIGQMFICVLEAGGQKLPIIKKNLSANSFNLRKSSFSSKVRKTYVVTKVTVCSIVTHLHHRELKSGALIQPETTETIPAYHNQAEKWYFYQKIQLYGLKYAILNRYAFESTNNEMINSEVTKMKCKFFYIPYKVWKIGILTKNTKDSHFLLEIHKPQYVVESPEMLIRKLLSIRIEREKCVKASKHAQNTCLWPKSTFSPKSQNAQHVRTCAIQNWIQVVNVT